MNWGHKIVIVYLIFITGIVFLVLKSSGEKQELVTTDYYEQELKFQQTIEATERANHLSAPVQYEISDNNIMLHFPQEMKNIPITAHVLLYCVANESRDVQRDINAENGEMQFSLSPANKGLHELKIHWTAHDSDYYYQHKLVIP